MHDHHIYQNRRVLRLWSRGPDVAYVQTALTGAGYNVGPIDGIYGPRTMQAVIDLVVSRIFRTFRGDPIAPTV
ncbi:MAG TPA: peptidoglycan-binding domain-containing protein, partial [Candidatus Atribacteria bacterium]|nr:peptidoglycan-binding domain-containing protein [Candidatus Atribacteria bacterium]